MRAYGYGVEDQNAHAYGRHAHRMSHDRPWCGDGRCRLVGNVNGVHSVFDGYVAEGAPSDLCRCNEEPMHANNDHPSA